MVFKRRDEGKRDKGNLSFPRRRESVASQKMIFKSLIKYCVALDSCLRGNDKIKLVPKAIFAFVTFFILSYTQAHAADYTQDLNDFINVEMKPWVNSDIVIDTLKKQNEQNANLADSNLKVLENKWRSELRKINQPLITQVMESDLSKFLKKTMESGQGVYTELTIIDAKGLDLGQTVISENYWNVGKPRWSSTFVAKSFTPYVSDVYYSDETNKFQVEVSFMIISNDQPIGVVAAGIDVEQLEDWKKRRK